jgi:hypothetical protein
MSTGGGLEADLTLVDAAIGVPVGSDLRTDATYRNGISGDRET